MSIQGYNNQNVVNVFFKELSLRVINVTAHKFYSQCSGSAACWSIATLSCYNVTMHHDTLAKSVQLMSHYDIEVKTGQGCTSLLALLFKTIRLHLPI